MKVSVARVSDVILQQSGASPFWEKYTRDADFEYVLQTKHSPTKMAIFEMLSFRLESITDFILLRVTGVSSRTALSAAGSEVQSLSLGETQRGVVANKQGAFKIYQLTQFGKAGEILVTVRACSGSVSFYVSEDFSQIFN